MGISLEEVVKCPREERGKIINQIVNKAMGRLSSCGNYETPEKVFFRALQSSGENHTLRNMTWLSPEIYENPVLKLAAIQSTEYGVFGVMFVLKD